MNTITFDVMVGGRFYRTLRMPLTLDIVSGYEGDKALVKTQVFKDFVERKCPTLKYEKYKICF